MLKKSPNNREHGFSLIELMVAITVMSLVMALGIPSYQAWIQNTRIRNAAESIQNGLQAARGEAVKRNTPIQFDLRGTNSAWTVCVAPAVAGHCSAADDATTLQSRNLKEGSSADITVVTTEATPFVFNSFGRLISPAPAAADGLLRVTVDTTALAPADSRELSIIIGAGGSAKMCDPATTLSATDPRKCP